MDLKCKECGARFKINDEDDNLVLMGYCQRCDLEREKAIGDKIIKAIKEAQGIL
jgi:hypothetical protein